MEHRGNIKGTKLPPEPLTADEVKALLAACSRRAPTGIRNAALVVVMWRGMLRVNEALSLKPADFNIETGELRILNGKGRKPRTVALDATASIYVGQWLRARAALRNATPRGRLFCTLGGAAMQPQYVRCLLPRLGRRAGVAKRIHAHGLRHSGACAMRRAGVDIGVISKALGHASIATTARYLDHIAPTAVIQAMRAMAW